MPRMLIEVRPGEGGDDAERFADECFDMLVAMMRTLGREPSDVTRSPRIRTFRVDQYAPELYNIAGTHRVQRIPKGSTARHTSTATIVVLEDELQPTS